MSVRLPRRALITAASGLACAGLHLLGAAAPALASTNQVAIIEDDTHMLADPVGTLQQFRKLGAGTVRVFLPWSAMAPGFNSTTEPANFDPTDSASYPDGVWDRWDAIDRAARQAGIGVDFTITGGSPRWAEHQARPSQIVGNQQRAWYPDAAKFGEFVRAAAKRYGGSYPDPQNPGQTLPRVSFWSIWNEPNFGEDLGPQAINGSRTSVAPGMYRSIVNSTWQAFQATGHGRDTIVIGELAARGLSGKATRKHPDGLPGNFAQTKPLLFIRTLYCVDSNNRELRGNAARSVGCPTTAGASRRFRAQNPGLFSASGFSDHPYPQDQPPTKDRSKDPNFASFSELPNMERELDKVTHVYGSGKHFAIYNDEYGYITHPPNKGRFVSPSTAAYYINWAEYLSWRSRRIASTMQYLLYDPPPNPALPQGGFASGLLTSAGKFLPAYSAYRLPLYMPVTSTRRRRSLEVWGCVRPAHFAAADTHQAQFVQIQLQRGNRGSFSTVKQIKVTSQRGYFDARVTFPASGTVRLVWQYPSDDPNLPAGTIYSRHIRIRLH
jgi:hypothetical protein